MQTTLNFGVNLSFVIGGILDTYRRLYAMQAMEQLLTTGYPANSDNRFVVDVTIPSNVTSWVLLRQIMQNFGFTYYLRIRLYVSYFVSVIGLIVLLLYISLLTGAGFDYTTLSMLVFQILLLTILIFWMV